MASGLGLGEFRQMMLRDKRLRELIDYPAANDVFPGVEVKAGVCYFLWDSNYQGNCTVTTVRGKQTIGPMPRDLSEYDVFVRDGRAMSILRKVRARAEKSSIVLHDAALPLLGLIAKDYSRCNSLHVRMGSFAGMESHLDGRDAGREIWFK